MKCIFIFLYNTFTIFLLNFPVTLCLKEINCQNFVTNNCQWNNKNGTKLNINADNPCIFSCSYDPSKDPGPVRFGVHALTNIVQSNMFVSVRQNHILSSWTLPIAFGENTGSQNFTSLEEILCPPRNENNESIFFRLTTNSIDNVKINISLTSIRYKIQLNENVTVKSTPVSPWFKLYEWQDGQESVLVSVKSVGKNEKKVCALLSLQNAKCPVATDKKGITASGEGRYQSFQEKGGMIAKRTMFPDGVHIVILPLSTDTMCTGLEADSNKTISRVKSTLLCIFEHETISQVYGKFLAFGVILAIVIIGSTVGSIAMIKRNLSPLHHEDSDFETQDLIEGTGNGISSLDPRVRRHFATGGLVFDGPHINEIPNDSSQYRPNQTDDEDQHSSNGNQEINGIHQRQGIRERLLAITGGNMDSVDPCTIGIVTSNNQNMVRDDLFNFSRQNNPRYVYWWKVWAEHINESPESNVSEIGFQRNLVMVAVFMALPFSEILRSYMNVFSYHGTEDQCFYNTECMTSFWIFPDFARVFTNIGYLLGGFCYWYTLKKHKKLNSKISAYETLGVSRNYSLFTALSFGLIIQFFMSSLYHICPNQVTLRFDMIFMYVDAIVLVVGVWGFRHGSVAPHVYPTVGLVGMALLAAEVREWVSPWLFWTIIASAQIMLTITTSVMLSRYGTWSFSPISMIKVWKDWKPVIGSLNDVLKEDSSAKPWTILRTVIGFSLNIVLVIVGCTMDMEVYMYILLVCVMNMTFYVANYIFTKALHGEKGTTIAWICFSTSLIFWVIAIVFYSMHFTNSETTAAVSRALNSGCVLMGVFDAHDVWHIASSLAMFYSFMGILTLDDDLACRNPRKIPVF